MFDWAEDIFPNADIKSGHYLKLTAGMRAIRETTLKCGYCEANYPGGHTASWCTACLDEPHLKQSELPLLVLMPAGAGFKTKRPVLSPDHFAALVTAYVGIQTRAKVGRSLAWWAKQRHDVRLKAENALACATEERDGMLWLLDHRVNIDNVIYDTHTRRFLFGWRTPVSPDLVEALVVAELCGLPGEFPFHYDINT